MRSFWHCKVIENAIDKKENQKNIWIIDGHQTNNDFVTSIENQDEKIHFFTDLFSKNFNNFFL